jgi:integrase
MSRIYRGHARLFYQCVKSANGYGDAMGKCFGRLLRVTLKLPLSLVLHSLRHGWITGLHAAGVPDQIVYTLCGHTAAGGEGHDALSRPFVIVQQVRHRQGETSFIWNV